MTGKTFHVERLGKEDVPLARKLFMLFQEVFEEEETVTAGDPYLEKLLCNPGFIVYAVFERNEIVGGLTAYELPMYYSEGMEIFIYDIAVRPAFQRKGLGRQLLSALKEHARVNGTEEIFVAADEEDIHALDFYRSTGGRAAQVVHFSYETGAKRTPDNNVSGF